MINNDLLFKIQRIFLLLSLWLIVFLNPKIFYNAYIQSKWSVIYLTTSLLIFSETLKIKQYKQNLFLWPKDFYLKILILGLVSGVVISSLNVPIYLLIPSFLDWSCAVIILWAIVKQISADKDQFFLKALIHHLLMISIVVIAYFIIKIDFSLLKSHYNSQILNIFFGNRNLLSEFLGFSFLILIYGALFVSLNKMTKIIMICVSGLILLIITFAYSRSVILGMFFSMLSICILQSKYLTFVKKKFLFLLLFLVVILPVINHIYVNFFQDQSIPVSQSKATSANVRKARWLNSLCMLRSHPLGVGSGQFEFNYTKHHECILPDSESLNENIVKTPHNGFLEIAIENGVLTLLSAIGIIVYLVFLARKLLSFNFGFIFLIYFLVIAFFAFPLETGGTFFISMIGFAYILKEIPFDVVSLSRFSFGLFRTFKTLFFILIIIGSVSSITSYYNEFKNYYDFSKISLACSIYPSNWRACLRKSQLLFESGKTQEAIESTQRFLLERPNHFVMIDQLGKFYWKIGERAKSCFYVKRFDDLFSNKSHLSHFYQNQCK